MEGTLPRILVVIPAYQEERSIGGLVRSLRERYPYDVLLVNDGSTDRTSESREGGGGDRPGPAVQPRDRRRGADRLPICQGSRLRCRRSDRRGRAARGRGHSEDPRTDPGGPRGRGHRFPLPRGNGVPGEHSTDLRHPLLPPPRQRDHRVPRDRPDLGLLRDQPAADRRSTPTITPRTTRRWTPTS